MIRIHGNNICEQKARNTLKHRIFKKFTVVLLFQIGILINGGHNGVHRK